jgi:isoleucyl-tRNA synthetase
VIVHTLNHLATVDLSAFYFDVSKDRLYTFGAASTARRSAQTAMYRIVEGLVRLLAPVLPVTTDELWRTLPGERADSVHLSDFPDDLASLRDDALVERWRRLIDVRVVVNAALEERRQQKVIGTPLEARVAIRANGDVLPLLRQHAADLPMLFIVSQAEVEEAAAGAEGLLVEVGRADGTKCVRCWRYVTDISATAPFDGLCGRCVDAVSASGSHS